jgi:hypothetical protein
LELALSSITVSNIPQPPMSAGNITVTPQVDGVEIFAPAPGMAGSPHSTLCIIFFLVIGFFTLIFTVAGWWHEGIHGIWQGPLIMLVFWIPYPFVLRKAIREATTQIRILAANGQLTIEQKGWKTEKNESWFFSELNSVKLGESGVEINDETVMGLEFLFKDKKKILLFAGEDRKTLEWLATVINIAMNR